MQGVCSMKLLECRRCPSRRYLSRRYQNRRCPSRHRCSMNLQLVKVD